MKKIIVGETEYLAVEVPEGLTRFTLSQGCGSDYLNGFCGAVLSWYKILPDGNYEIVGLVKDLTNNGIIIKQVQFDWLLYKNQYNLSNNTLLIKIISYG